MKNLLNIVTILIAALAMHFTRLTRVRTNFALYLDEAAILEAIKGVREDILPVVKKIQEDQKTVEGNRKEDRDLLKALEAKYDVLLSDFAKEQQRSSDLELKFGKLNHTPGNASTKSLGQIVRESEAFEGYRKNRGKMTLKLEGENTKAITGLTGPTGNVLLRPDRQDGIIAPIMPKTRVRDLFTQATTESNAVEFVRELVFTNNAAMVANAGQKPESDLTFELMTVNVRTVAHFIRAAKQIIDDVGQLEAYINGRMIDGLKDREDAQLMTGDGTGQNLTGIITQAAAYSRGVVGDTRVDTVRRAMTQIALAGMQGEGVVLHPADWEKIELLKGTNNMYIWISVVDGGVPRLFRMPVVETIAMAEGKFLAGAFKQGAILFDRQEVIVEMFEQDTDNVQKNMLTIRAEERLALAVIRPAAFVQGNILTV
jgi:HK97 family phage major capsid protein